MPPGKLRSRRPSISRRRSPRHSTHSDDPMPSLNHPRTSSTRTILIIPQSNITSFCALSAFMIIQLVRIQNTGLLMPKVDKRGTYLRKLDFAAYDEHKEYLDKQTRIALKSNPVSKRSDAELVSAKSGHYKSSQSIPYLPRRFLQVQVTALLCMSKIVRQKIRCQNDSPPPMRKPRRRNLHQLSRRPAR